jgi:ParB family chromosome partitioning protein
MEKRLGRGLGSLLPSKSEPEAGPSMIPVDAIRPNRFQPRKHFDESALAELRDSIRTHGVLQPIAVRQDGSQYELIAGERRWRAAKEAGLARIPAVVRASATDAAMLELALVENVQRADLDPIERALGYQRMVVELGLTQQGVAERVGLKRSTVANHIRLLELSEPIQRLVAPTSWCSSAFRSARSKNAFGSSMGPPPWRRWWRKNRRFRRTPDGPHPEKMREKHPPNLGCERSRIASGAHLE